MNLYTNIYNVTYILCICVYTEHWFTWPHIQKIQSPFWVLVACSSLRKLWQMAPRFVTPGQICTAVYFDMCMFLVLALVWLWLWLWLWLWFGFDFGFGFGLTLALAWPWLWCGLALAPIWIWFGFGLGLALALVWLGFGSCCICRCYSTLQHHSLAATKVPFQLLHVPWTGASSAQDGIGL